MKKLFVGMLFLGMGCCVGVSVQAQRADSSAIAYCRQVKPFLRFGKRSNKLVLSLETLHVQKEVFWFRFSIRNESGLAYPVELCKLYIRDKNHGPRSSQQEIELVPLYADTLKIIPAHTTVRFFIALDQFTIPDNKSCFLELFETNGGRNLSLAISNRQLFLARPVLPVPTKEKK